VLREARGELQKAVQDRKDALQQWPKAADRDEGRSAILRWRPQILELPRKHINERYSDHRPPIMPLLLTPLARLSPLPCALTWYALAAALAIASHFAVAIAIASGFPVAISLTISWAITIPVTRPA